LDKAGGGGAFVMAAGSPNAIGRRIAAPPER
jgi:hypothetical protein